MLIMETFFNASFASADGVRECRLGSVASGEDDHILSIGYRPHLGGDRGIQCYRLGTGDHVALFEDCLALVRSRL